MWYLAGMLIIGLGILIYVERRLGEVSRELGTITDKLVVLADALEGQSEKTDYVSGKIGTHSDRIASVRQDTNYLMEKIRELKQ